MLWAHVVLLSAHALCATRATIDVDGSFTMDVPQAADDDDDVAEQRQRIIDEQRRVADADAQPLGRVAEAQRRRTSVRTRLEHASVLAMPPRGDRGSPATVLVGFFVESMGSLDVQDMSFDIDMYFRLSWVDNRLAANHAHNESARPISDLLVTDPRTVQMWTPDLYFVNVKRANFHRVMRSNMAMWLEADGTVAYSSRVSATVACPQDLAYYPLDRQKCSLRMMSYAHDESQVQLHWFDVTPISTSDNIELAEFVLTKAEPTLCNASYEYGKTHKGSRYAQYSCLEVHFYFERQITYHLVQTYIPSGAIVGISWVSFWIDPAAVPARVSLSFTTLLTLTTMGSGVRFSLPAVSYAKAIDHWFFTCMFFVFAALLEFAVVNSYMRRGQSYDKRAEMVYIKQNRRSDNGICAPLTGLTANIIQNTGDYYRKRAGQVDRICRFVFPSGFLAFNLFYWLYFGSLFR